MLGIAGVAAALGVAGVVNGCGTTGDGDAGAERTATGALTAAGLPTPRDFTRYLDLECYQSGGIPPVQNLGIRQLNPVLKDKLPNQRIKVFEQQETCLPVAKNHSMPNPDILRFAEMFDLACYRAEADPVDVTVNLKQLNPVLADIPDQNVRLRQLRRFCAPVRKNFATLDADVLSVMSYMDFACYQFDELTPSANRSLTLSHLNPVVVAMNQPDRQVKLGRANQLCVPVGKNQQQIPQAVLDDVEWADFENFELTLTTPQPSTFYLWLSQLNPLFAGFGPLQVPVFNPHSLMVPVAKNHQLPPNE